MTDDSFKLIEFPKDRPDVYEIMGHDRFYPNTLQGSLDLVLRVVTPVHISAGISALGQDVGDESVAMVRPMVQSVDGKLIIQGSSLKGCVRSIYEVITNSKCGTESDRAINLPNGYEPAICNLRKRQTNLCSAGNVFGAMGYQGLVSFSDAVSEDLPEIGYLRPMFSPKSVRRYVSGGRAIGRKFYYHEEEVRRDEESVVAVQQARKGASFATRVQVRNLGLDKFGALLIALGQDSSYPIALKLGAGKAQGMGSVRVEVARMNIVEPGDLVAARYQSYGVSQSLSKGLMERAIDVANKSLIDEAQLVELFKVLGVQSNEG